MESGKILPLFRQFFGAVRTGSANRDSGSSQYHQQQRERDATQEEAERAAALLGDSEEFQRNGLVVAADTREGRPVLLVTDSSGTLLRVIQSPEIVRILLATGTPDSPRQGRILDRRI